MTEFLIRHFVKDYEEVEKVSVRTAYGMLSGIVGIFCNVILFLTKLIVGLVLNSVSVTADAFNNLSDAGFCGRPYGRKAGGQRSSVRAWADRVHSSTDRLFSSAGGWIYFSEGFGGKDPSSGAAEIPSCLGVDFMSFDRGEAVAWTIQQKAGRKD